MSATIILSARPAKEKLEALLKEVQEMDLTPLEQMLTREETRQQHEARKRIIEERTMRLKLHIGTLETINTNWIQYIQQVPATKRKEEEDKYAQMSLLKNLGNHTSLKNRSIMSYIPSRRMIENGR
uniref:Uncharacterized protein n=1 Tax=Wuchereria bancrofti TaxID=6293 RepID=A0AAF5Q4Y9_WUCBA